MSDESPPAQPKMLTKQARTEWIHFNQVAVKDGKVVRIQCKYCDWMSAPNATRVAKHCNRMHAKDVAQDCEYADEAQESAPPPAKRARQELIRKWVEKVLAERRKLADRKLAVLQVKYGLSLAALTSEEMRQFCGVLAPAYHLVSRPTLQSRVHEIHAELQTAVGHVLSRAKVVCLAPDCWEDAGSGAQPETPSDSRCPQWR